MKTPREIAEDVLERESWATALWDREAAIALVVEAVEESRREVAALIEPKISQEFKVGDWVVLDGSAWRFDLALEKVHITGFANGSPYFVWDGLTHTIGDFLSGYSATKVED